MNNDSQQVIYKNHVVKIPHISQESNTSFEMRKWYILKNLHLTKEYSSDSHKACCSLEELINFSKLHIQKEIYNCKFDENTMKWNDRFEKALYILSDDS